MSVSAGNISYGQHLLQSWSKDQTVIALSSGEAELYAACMAAQQAMGKEKMARDLGVHLDAMELQVDADAAIGIIGKQGLGKLRHLDLSYLWLQSAVRKKQLNLKIVQSESNMADLGTNALEKDKTDLHMKNLGCVRFDRQSRGRCERTPQNDDETRSTLTSISMSNPALSPESVSAHVYDQVHQKHIVYE